MPNRQALAPGVHVAVVDDDLVFLDVPQDRYVCLPGVALTARVDAGRTAIDIDSPALLGELREAGLTTEAQAPRAPWRAPPRPEVCTLRREVEAPRLRDVPEGARAVTDLWVAYRGRSLAELLKMMPSPKGDAPSTGSLDEVVRIAIRFQRWAPFAPTSAKCLLRTFMLRRLLRRRGQDALWVFGVRTRPFGAHCWLQADGIVLDDDVDRIAAFEPILVV